MLNKIKNKILHIVREKCGYYELRQEMFDLDDKWLKDYEDLESIAFLTQRNLEELSSKYEAKILEYDILDNKFKQLVNIITSEHTMNNHYCLEEIILYYNSEKMIDYKKYLIQELEQILNIMKGKGIHPQDLIKRIINKAKRDIK